MVGPAVLTFVKELGEFYGSNRPQLFGFIDSLEAVDINSPGLEFLDGSHFWEGSPRYAQANDSEAQKAYRAAVGIDDNGAAVERPEGRLDRRAYVRLLGDALCHQEGDGGLPATRGRRTAAS